MKVGDLVKRKVGHAGGPGIITWCDPNIHDSVTYRVKVSWPTFDCEEQFTYNWRLEVIDESNSN